MKKKIIGKCHICGKNKELTFEHIPPKSANNSAKAKVINGKELLGRDDKEPWDYTECKYKEQQRGMGKYTLCNSCNNLTGKWYVPEYNKFAYTMGYFLQEAISKGYTSLNIELEKVKVLNIIKQVISMFASTISAECFDKNTQLRELVLNRQYNEIDINKYRIGMYLIKEPKVAFTGVNALFIKGCGTRVVASMDIYPLGFTLDFNTEIVGKETNMTDIIMQTEYNKEYNLQLSVPILERNIIFPTDYRTKEEILLCREQNKRYTNKK